MGTKVVTSGSTALRTSTMSLKMPPSAALVHTVLKAGCRSSVLHRDCRPFSTGRPSRSIERLTVFGAGLMGAGIAQVAAHNGIKVVLTDVSEDAINNGKSIIHKSLTRVARKKHPDSDKDQKAHRQDVREFDHNYRPECCARRFRPHHRGHRREYAGQAEALWQARQHRIVKDHLCLKHKLALHK